MASSRAGKTTKTSSNDWRSSEKLYYRIGEVSRITGIKPYVLRYWESEFSLMSPAKSRSKQRLYRKRDIETILLIKTLLYEERFTIAGAKKRLRELGRTGEGEHVEPEAEKKTKEQLSLELAGESIEQFRKIREELQSLRALI